MRQNFNHILQLDAQLSTRLRSIVEISWLRTICIILAHSGDSWFWLGGLLLIAVLAGNAWRGQSIIFMIGILVTAVLTMAAKFTIRRQRPPGEWGEVYRSVDPHSFPSGHASRVVMLAVLSAAVFPAWVALLLLVWALLVSLARVAMGVHYLSDIAAGAVLGLLIGLIAGQILPPIFL